MNFAQLFKMQQELKEHIGYEGKDKKEKMGLALLVELGESANEHRGFKYWSEDQEPRTKSGNWIISKTNGEVIDHNPLLEEYVDGLHFILEFALDFNLDTDFPNDYVHNEIPFYKKENVTEQYLYVFDNAIYFLKNISDDTYEHLLLSYVALGEMLGFTNKDIFKAYTEKNKVNHERQDNGY